MEETRLGKLSALRDRGIDPYPSKSLEVDGAASLQERFKDLGNDEYSDQTGRIAGRVMAIRNSGMFVVVKDEEETIQLYNDPQNEDLKLFIKTLDIGDIIYAEGQIRRTKRGELTLKSHCLIMLSKALRSLPEKHHGLKDTDQRYRQRYLDMISNRVSAERFLKRSKLIESVRRTLVERKFLEVETPMLQPVYGGATALPFRTHHNALDRPLYLRIAPELYLKQVLVGGLSNRVFEINRNFRNEGISTRHNPEFTMLEAYQAYGDMEAMIDLVEAIFERAALDLHGTTTVGFGDKHLTFQRPFTRRPMADLVREATGMNFLDRHTDDEARQALHSLGLDCPADATWGECLSSAFEERVEHTLTQPTHVTDLPADISPFSKRQTADRRLSERFETYVNGWEIANAFSEQNDPLVQRHIMEEQLVQAHERGEKERTLDEDFLRALEHGMPPAGGLGIGIDRLCMVLTDAASIRDVILFPARRPEASRDEPPARRRP